MNTLRHVILTCTFVGLLVLAACLHSWVATAVFALLAGLTWTAACKAAAQPRPPAPRPYDPTEFL